MRGLIFAALFTGFSLAAVTPAAAEVRITIADGFVSVEARDATVRQILQEWARVGQTRVVNAERLAGGPITLHLVRVPEAQALDILLRSVSGYMAAPRPVRNPTISQFDRILVMPSSVAPRPANSPATPQPQPAFAPPPAPMPADDVDMDEPGNVPPGTPVNRGPVFPPFPGANGQPGNFPQRGPVFPPVSTSGPNVSPNGPNANPTPNPNPNAAFPPPMPQPMPFPGGTAAPGRSTAPVGVSTPGMMVQPQGVPPPIAAEPQG